MDFCIVCKSIRHGRGVAPSANYLCFDKDLTISTNFEVSTSTWSTQTWDMYDSDVDHLVAATL